ncbi:OmpA family protein [Pseudobacteriovorax antillogorgiicola]|uniref:Outer membrane protein OmpA n=1 Tax=Pseudobacteriovorax antillogorgiicola TaxID=1513793 RepID=A0A1Y6C7R1_9BACT|nr:OmpA family protein [Pseudobacteriovorax antillogorgiicola]TCS51708.1 outer membrane protein OmpA-like peptidoglycan-associated protein [Pseudobacteriovorax antillogorgiicola]SMF49292.1 Outer membrane protein OmpA [Pseudobacteriovorax antillogorgiicola]
MWKTIVAVFLLYNSAAFANTIGSDHQNFNQGISFVDYLTVHSSKTLGAGGFSLSLGLNHGVNTLPYFEQPDGNRDILKEYNDGLSAMDVNFALGLSDRFDLSLSVPYIVHQRVADDDQYHGQFDKMGNTEVRGGFKWRFLEGAMSGLALVGTVNYNRVENNPYTGDEEWPAYSLELAGELQFGQIHLAANLGHRWRNSGESIAFDNDTPIEPYENQWLFSSAVEWFIPSTRWSALAEFYGNYTKTDIVAISPRNASVLEGVAGLRYRPIDQLILQAGGGAEMRHAVSSADQRYFVGLLWKFDIDLKRDEPVLIHEPAPSPPQVKTSPDLVIQLEDIQFAYDSYRMSTGSEKSKLDKVKSVLQNHHMIERVVVEGHACKLGSDEYNFGLSDRRADTVLDWVVDEVGVPREKVIPVGYGESRPHASNDTSEGRSRNRRVKFEIFYKQ